MPGQKSAKTSIIFLTFSLGLVIARPGLMSQGMQDVVNELREILVGSGYFDCNHGNSGVKSGVQSLFMGNFNWTHAPSI